jgi:hypothetical protein
VGAELGVRILCGCNTSKGNKTGGAVLALGKVLFIQESDLAPDVGRRRTSAE